MADTQMLSKYLPKKLYNAAADEDGTDLTAKDALPEDRLDTIEALLGTKAAQTGSTISENVANLVTLVGDYAPEDTDLATDLTAALGDIDALQAVAPEYAAKFATATAATATYTSDETNPAVGSTVVVNDQTYRFMDTMTQANDVQIGADADTTLANLVHAINNTGAAGTNWYAGTSAATDVTAAAVGSHATVVTADTKGTAANAYKKGVSTDPDSHIVLDATEPADKFSGGVNGQIGATGKIIFTATGVYCCTDGEKCVITDSDGWKSVALSGV